jgi:ATP-dependent DNA helicase RecG
LKTDIFEPVSAWRRLVRKIVRPHDGRRRLPSKKNISLFKMSLKSYKFPDAKNALYVFWPGEVKMAEHQIIERIESWRDDFLKCICGLANAEGGKIRVGADGEGKVVGAPDAKKLREHIANKALKVLGIAVDVNLLTDDGHDCLEIVVHPSAYPVDFRGEWLHRSGSETRPLRGAALAEFLLTKSGSKWEAVPVDGVTVDDLDKESFDIFRKAALRAERMRPEDLQASNTQLLNSLHLIDKPSGKLTRAAILLFHREPEKWMTGSFVKVGYFADGPDLRYQDEIKGSLMAQADMVVDLIYLKYVKAHISYDGAIRTETWPFPQDGVREAIFNALMHNHYPSSIPIQIRIHEDKLYVSNSCVFPVGWTAETLTSKHDSQPRNPLVANAFFRAGHVEKRGCGIERICEACAKHGLPDPEYVLHPGDVMVKFEGLKCTPSSIVPKGHVGALDGALEKKLLDLLREKPGAKQVDLAEHLRTSPRTVKRLMKKLSDGGAIVRTGGKRFGYWEIR